MSFGDGFWWGVGASDVAERGAAPAGDRRTARPVPAEPAPDPVDPVALLARWDDIADALRAAWRAP